MKDIFSCLIAMLLVFGSISCQTEQSKAPAEQESSPQYDPPASEELAKVKYSKAEWQEMLSPQEYYVLREAGTERAFTGDLLQNKQEGVYTCRGCGLPLFTSETKFKSGTGWPSFWEPIDEKYVLEVEDNKYGMRRVEVICGRCEGHLGHVFPDGPPPTGLRYCLNSVSLDFVPQEDVKQP